MSRFLLSYREYALLGKNRAIYASQVKQMLGGLKICRGKVMILTHNKKHFYKYTSSQSGKLMLKNASIKISRASEFNDPFDRPIQV